MLDEFDDTYPVRRLPPRWRHPPRVEIATGHHLRPVTGSDVDLHLRAVLESRDRLWSIYGRTHRWPPRGLTVEQDRADLARRAADAEARRSFSYGLFDLGETELLGCVDIDPGGSPGFNPTVSWWVVDWLVDSPVERALEAHLPAWVAEYWPSAAPSIRDRNCVSDVRAGVRGQPAPPGRP